MTLEPRERYFIRRLDDDSYRPVPEAEFEIVFEDDDLDICAYVDGGSRAIIALIHFTPNGPASLPIQGHGIPDAVIEAARQRRAGPGEYVNERGEIVRPSFLPPE